MKEDPRFERAAISTAERHLFLCIGPECCHPEAGEAVWQYLKAAVKQFNLPVLRTKAACFRICSGGPWLVIYPEGIWYGELTPERCERILEEHIKGQQPIREWISAEHPLIHQDYQ